MSEHSSDGNGGASRAQDRAGDRRSRDRVKDDQSSGHGSMSALSKLKMLERKRAAIRPGRRESPED